jgi:diaminopimelate decarboxylase
MADSPPTARSNGWISRAEDGWLHCEDWSIQDLGEEFGLPLWVTSAAQIRRNASVLSDALRARYENSEVIYASKANPQPALFALMSEIGLGVDVVTMGHIRLAIAGHIRPEQVIFNGNAKTLSELAWAIQNRVRCINIDSLPEFHRIIHVASTATSPVRVCLRLATETDRHADDPEIAAKEPGKFGMTRAEALEAVAIARSHPKIHVVGLHHHFGFTGASAQVTLDRHRNFVRQLVDVAREVEALSGRPIEILNIGGGLRKGRETGFGPGRQMSFPTVEEYAGSTAGEMRRLLNDNPLASTPRLIVEAGGYLVADATVLLAAVCFEKPASGSSGSRWIFLENTSAYHFVRRLMFDFYHEVRVASPLRAGQPSAANVAGPICTDDDIARGSMLPPVMPGDIIAVMDQGAYCEAITSDYCAVPIPAAVMLKGEKVLITRQRTTWDDLASVFPDPAPGTS